MAKRVIIIILDSVGIGYAPDAKASQSQGIHRSLFLSFSVIL